MRLDDTAALLLFEAVARQAHRDAAGMDRATIEERCEARAWLADWQECEPAGVRVAPVRAEYAKGASRRKRGQKPVHNGA